MQHLKLPRGLVAEQQPVWDPLVRVFHWSLVLFFSVAWLSGGEWDTLHIWSGYTVAALVGFRLVWGLIGTRYARFSDFIYSRTEIIAYLKGLLSGRAKHYVGHNPAGGLMVITLLLSLAMLTFSGLALLATNDGGPLVNTFIADWPSHWLKEIHGFFANLMVLLIGLHVGGVVLSSLAHRENLVRSMITGRKRIPQGDLHEKD